MKHPPILIKKIAQKDNYTFNILWSDGVSNNFRLSHLQKMCPCAKCFDPATGKQLCTEAQVDPQVRAERVVNVGRYALKVQFTSGCSRGIYSYAFLRGLAKES